MKSSTLPSQPQVLRNVLTLCAAMMAFLPDGIIRQASSQQAVLPEHVRPLIGDGDLASDMVDGIDQFLLKKTDVAQSARDQYWEPNVSSLEAFVASVRPNRDRLVQLLGVGDSRMKFAHPDIVAAPGGDGIVASNDSFTVYAVRWSVLEDPAPATTSLASVTAEGLLLLPTGAITADVVAVPDAGQSPEQLVGISDGLIPESQYAARLAASGCRVLIPLITSRERSARNGRATLTDREYLHRSAFELGRTLAGYEIQKILAAVDWFRQSAPDRKVGVIGYGEGGHLALLAGAVDERIDVTAVSGFFGPRARMWQEPVDRNLAGFVREFDCDRLAVLIAPRGLVVELTPGPTVLIPGDGGAPGELTAIDLTEAAAQFQRAKSMIQDLPKAASDTAWSTMTPAADSFCTAAFTDRFLLNLTPMGDAAATATGKTMLALHESPEQQALRTTGRRISQREEIDRHNQALLRESSFVRDLFMSKLDTSSEPAYRNSVEQYRTAFRDDVIGSFQDPLLPPDARSRQVWETDGWTGYEIVMDVFPDVMAYGVLLVPKDMKPGEKRPVVVCQHGLEGRPTDTFLGDHYAYHDFAARLCERGFITFAPQNPYIFTDRFRTLQRKAQPLGCSLFSVIVPQHQQMVNWLKSQSFVDPDRIAFYGLSYGGKSAMRIPALVTDYCLSICSADFNEWVLKNAGTRENFSYVWTGEYEIFEWNLGNTFNYAEMAALICPRPFMVERGHFDGVGVDEWVAFEYAKVRRLYAAKLKIPDRTEIEWFDGPHTINGRGTYRFLHKHLDWPSSGN